MDDASLIEESQSALGTACPSRRTPSAICCSSKAAPDQPFLGTARLEALHYWNVDISKFYPYGDPHPIQQRSRPC
jgi:hypothetical protein